MTTGNEADLAALEYLRLLLEDPETRVIAMFVEGLKHAERLPALAVRAAREDKFIVAAKVGRSDVGRRAALAHTAHVAGDDVAYDAVFRHYGIARAYDQEELMDFAMAFSRAKLPAGDRIGVLTMSGGAGAWMADALDEVGLAVPLLSEQLQLDPGDDPPLWVGDQPGRLDRAGGETAGGMAPLVAELGASGEVDAIVLVFPLASAKLLAREQEAITRAIAETPVPVLVYTYSGAGADSVELAARANFAFYTSSHRTARVLRALVDQAQLRRRGVPEPPPRADAGGEPIVGRPRLEHDAARAVLAAAGVDPKLAGSAMVRAHRDPDHGPIVAVELAGRRTVVPAPLTVDEAMDAVAGLGASSGLAAAVSAVSMLIATHPEIAEIDLPAAVVVLGDIPPMSRAALRRRLNPSCKRREKSCLRSTTPASP